MPVENQQQIIFKDFSAGWCPSDDAINGRKNALLKMDGCTLDDNGSLMLEQGAVKTQGPYAAKAHTLFVKRMCGEYRVYVGLVDGSVWRNNVNLIPAGAGSTSQTAFGVFGDYVLIISGDKRVKDFCGAPPILNLGLQPPTVAPLINIFNNPQPTTPWAGTLANYVAEYGTLFINEDNLELITAPLLYSIYYNACAVICLNTTDFPPMDLSGSDDDIFSFDIQVDSSESFRVVSIVFLVSDTPGGDPVTRRSTNGIGDTYEYSWANLDPNFPNSISPGLKVISGTVQDLTWKTLSAKRSEFERFGTNPVDWHNIVGVELQVKTDLNAPISDILLKNFTLTYQATVPDTTTHDSDGLMGNLLGTYQWVQVNVFVGGGYTALSAPGPVTVNYDVINGYAEVIPQDPTIIEPNANEVWIYRRGGLLNQFYRVGRILYDELGPLYDDLSDIDALALGIVLNTHILPIDAANLPEQILEVVGPVFNRMVYFSATSIYFSETSNPDAYDPRNVIKLVSDSAEKFQWARKVAENTIMIGTLKDVYILTGTYIQFPDGALDIYLRSLGVNKPPMSRFVTVYNGTLIYFASQDWVAMAPNGAYQTLIAPNTDILYTGQTRYGYGGVPTYIDTTDISYACVIAKNKLWVTVPVIADYDTPTDITTWSQRMEVFDFTRKCWRPSAYTPFLLAISDDEALWGFISETMTVAYLDSPFTKLLSMA